METNEPEIEVYTSERKAEFLLQYYVGEKDYEKARERVRKLGINPDSIPHDKPTQRT